MSSEAHAAVERALRCPAWGLIRLHEDDALTIVGGSVLAADRLADIPLRKGPIDEPVIDTLVAVPFRQIAERGFVAHDDGTPLAVIEVTEQSRIGLEEALAVLPNRDVEFSDRGGFEVDDAAYADVVRQIITDEIGRGEGANLVVGRTWVAQLAEWSPAHALSVLRRLLTSEHGAYWTYAIWTGERFLVGASPERHVSVAGGEVRMNPISGTFRLRDSGDADRKEKLLDFLADQKEIYELFMVVDEELKMMCDICHEGGQVLGPFLKPMSHLVHTEYVLAGRTHSDVRDVLRDTMFAATVTGAPVENACRLIARYEPGGRGYYSGALALIGRDANGPTVDSPIVIRTAEVTESGRLSVRAGATLVRDSDPDSEVAETAVKASGILSAFGLVPAAPAPSVPIADLITDPQVQAALAVRNADLARFWLTDQSVASVGADPALLGRSVAILHGEDDFANMLAHMFTVLGLKTTVLPWREYQSFDAWDLVVVGPGPGDPRDEESAKIATFRTAVDDLLASGKPFLAVCLGHQVLCDRLGIELAFKDIVFQGTQSEIEIAGEPQRVGFYNTFVARAGNGLPAGLTADIDAATGDIHVLRGPHYRGVQFHAESILTTAGLDILRSLLTDIVR